MLWSSLKQHGNSRWVRSSYFWLFFVPVVVRLLIILNEGGTFDLGERHFSLNLAIPFSWKLFYFGAVCFSLANFVYYSACPPLVRDYDGFAQFADVGKGSDYLLTQFTVPKLVRMILGEGWRHESDLAHFIKNFTSGERLEGGMDFRKYRDEVANADEPVISIPDVRSGEPLVVIAKKFGDAFWFARNAADDSHPQLRYLCTGALIAGYGAFLFVSLQGFWYVLWA